MIVLSIWMIALLFGLFILWSPGMVFTLPPLAQTDIQGLGVGYMNGSPGSAAFCSSGTRAEPECSKPMQMVTSGYTNIGAMALHSLVFLLTMLILVGFLFGQYVTPGLTLWLTILFFVLQPGLILTLPNMSAKECGQDGKNIMDNEPGVSPLNPKFCAGTYDSFPAGTSFTSAYPNCRKCTSVINSQQTKISAVLVHAAIFSALSYVTARWLF
jgi:hypothetical protein